MPVSCCIFLHFLEDNLHFTTRESDTDCLNRAIYMSSRTIGEEAKLILTTQYGNYLNNSFPTFLRNSINKYNQLAT